MDLKGFKKVGSTDTHTTFQHPDGHILHVANKAVDGSKKNEMKKLPKYDVGGVVDPAYDKAEEDRKESTGNGPASGGATPMGSHAKYDLETQQNLNADAASNRGSGHYQSNRYAHGGIAHYDEGTPDEPVSQDDAAPAAIPQNSQQSASTPMLRPLSSQEMGAVPGLNQTIGAERQNAQDISRINQARQTTGDNSANELQNLDANFQSSVGKVLDMSHKIATDLNSPESKINPDSYREHQGVVAKIATVLGLALGGFAQGTTGSNPAMDFLNKQIDRDIAGQQANINNKVTLMGELNKEFGNRMQATDMTRLALMQSNALKMQGFAAASNSADVKLRAQQNIYQMMQQAMPLAMRISTVDHLGKLAQSGGIDPENPKASQAAIDYLVQDPAERAAMKKEVGISDANVAAHKTVDNIVGQIVGQQNLANRVVNPIQSKQIIDAARAQLIPLVTKFSPSKRLTEPIIDEQINKLIPSLLSKKATGQVIADNLHNLVDSGTDPTPNLKGLEAQTGIPFISRYQKKMPAREEKESVAKSGAAKAGSPDPNLWEKNPKTGKYRPKQR